MNIKNNNLIDIASPDSSPVLLRRNNAEVSRAGGDRLSDVNSAIVREWIVKGGPNN